MSKGTRRGLASALTFVIAAVGGVIGNRITDAITPALIVFAILIVLGAIPSYLIGRGDDSSAIPVTPPTAGPQDAPAPQPRMVIAEGSGSVAVGGNNTGFISTNGARQPDPSDPKR